MAPLSQAAVRQCSRLSARLRSDGHISLIALAILLISGCGGGGSDSGGGITTPPPPPPPPSGVSMSVSPQSVSVSATTAESAPTGTFQVILSGEQPSQQIYLTGNYTTSGIASVSDASGASPITVTILFKSPATLGVGGYKDTLQVSACYDQACTEPVTNSPQTVQVTYTVTAAPMVQLSSLSPASGAAGGPAFTLTVTGVNFTSQSQVEWNGSPRTTTFVSSTQLTAQIMAADIATAGSVPVTVIDPVSGLSQPIYFTIQPPLLSLSSISPAAAVAGGPAFTLTATGQNFTSQSQVQWNGSPRSTTFVSATQLTAQITAADIAAVGSVPVTVIDPVNGLSQPINFTIQQAMLSLTSVSPTTVTVGGPSFMLTVLGSGFTATSTVQWKGTAVPTTVVGGSELIAQIPATDIAALGTAAVTVHDPSSSVGTTPAQTVTIAAASKDAVAFQINPAHSGAVTFASLSFPTSPAWSVDVGGTPSYALIVNGMVYVTVNVASGSSQLVALNQATGATVWGPIVISGSANATYDNGKLFVISAPFAVAATMEALDPATGKLLWSTLLAGQYSFTAAPTAANGLVYTGGAGSGGTLYALDEATGSIVWTQQVQNGDNSIPAVTADGVYVTYPCWTYDFRPATGESIWNNNTGCEGGGGATPVVANQKVYSPNGVSGYSGDVFNAETGASAGSYTADSPAAFNTTTGYFLQSGTLRGVTLSNNSVIWSFAGDGQLAGSPIMVNQYVFIGSSSGNLYALDGTTGSQAWQVSLGAAVGASVGAMPFSGLAAGDGLLVVPAGTKVTAYLLSAHP